MQAKKQAPAFDPQPVLDLIASIEADLERLKGMLQPPAGEFDPADPRNKTGDGKLTPEGVETCYRMFDKGSSRYSVARAMKISFAAATHRLNAWRKAGGDKRKKVLLG
jgi:murein L,D-transpeptidase YafK